MNHKAWLDNEYQLWADALTASTVHNFREHPQVKRMLGEVDATPYHCEEVANTVRKHWDNFFKVQNIGYSVKRDWLTGAFVRMVYWAIKVLVKQPKSICEIGAGVGEFYAILRALGYEGTYYIYDLPAVKEFQLKFLTEAERVTGMGLTIGNETKDFCVSFYALGEFDDTLKQWYIENVVNKCEHGLIVWNPHTGASEEINIDHAISIENLADGTLKITW